MKSIFFKVFLLIGILGLIILYDISKTKAQEYPSHAITVSGALNWQADPAIVISENKPVTILKAEVQGVRKLSNGISVDPLVWIWCTQNEYPILYAYENTLLLGGTTPTTWGIQNSTQQTHTCSPDSNGDNVSVWPELISTETGSIFYSITYVVGSSTATTTEPMNIENPTQNIYHGLVLFFIMFFGFIYYFKTKA